MGAQDLIGWLSDAKTAETPLHRVPARIATDSLPISPWRYSEYGWRDSYEEAALGPVVALWDASQKRLRPFASDLNQSASSRPEWSAQLLARLVRLPTAAPLLEAYGLEFKEPDQRPLQASLPQSFRAIHQAHDAEMRRIEQADPALADRPAEMVHELRLLHWTHTQCTALVITRSTRMYAKTSIDLASIHLKRTADGNWEPYDPLERISDTTAFAETIRGELNRQGASGDWFIERYPDPTARIARDAYFPLQIGSKLYLLFEPYTVHAGVFGTITVRVAN